MNNELKKYRVLKAVAINGIVGAGEIVELTETAAANIGIGEYLEEVVPEIVPAPKGEGEPAPEVPEEPQAVTASETTPHTEEKSEVSEPVSAKDSEAKPKGEGEPAPEGGDDNAAHNTAPANGDDGSTNN